MVDLRRLEPLLHHLSDALRFSGLMVLGDRQFIHRKGKDRRKQSVNTLCMTCKSVFILRLPIAHDS